MKVIHCAYQRYGAPGIVRQMMSEQAAADAQGLAWTSRIFFPSDVALDSPIVVRGNVPSTDPARSLQEYYAWVKGEAERHDVLLPRYLSYSPAQLSMLATLRVPTFLVHHSKEGPEILSTPGALSGIKSLADYVLSRLSAATTKGSISVTREIARYEQSRSPKRALSLVYPNGIDFGETSPVAVAKDDAEGPNIVFAASVFHSWQGLDRLIAAANRDREKRFRIHLIGQVLERDLVEAQKDPRFVVHGAVSSAATAQIVADCRLGLSAFALDRKGLTEACTLKVREYLLAGVPVYAGHNDVFPTDFPFYRHGNCDIEVMLSMANESRTWMPEAVREAARPFIDKRVLLGRLVSELETALGRAGRR